MQGEDLEVDGQRLHEVRRSNSTIMELDAENERSITSLDPENRKVVTDLNRTMRNNMVITSEEILEDDGIFLRRFGSNVNSVTERQSRKTYWSGRSAKMLFKNWKRGDHSVPILDATYEQALVDVIS